MQPTYAVFGELAHYGSELYIIGYRNSFFFRLVNYRQKNIRVK